MSRHGLLCVVAAGALALAPAAGANPGDMEISASADDGITLVVRDTDIREVFEMVARDRSLNIAMSNDIDGEVSISLFNVQPDEIIHAIAHAAGYAVENRGGTYVIVNYDELGKDTANGAIEVRTYKTQYTPAEKVRQILDKHLSRHGEVTALPESRIIVVEDKPEFLDRIERILEEIDQQPKQILLEAKLLEVALTQNDTLGIDWSRVSSIGDSTLNVGVRGLATGASPGLFFNVLNENLEGAIEALTDAGRVRALATPRLMTMENQEAEVLVGDRLGYRVTTTINQVTTESVEFVESGVILRFVPSVDRQGRVLLQIHPEVSTGTITDGVPSVTTTELTTQLLAEDGERIFIGGLIRNSASEGRRGVPLLSQIPVFGLLFARSEWSHRSTETIVIVKPTVHTARARGPVDREQKKRLDTFEPVLEKQRLEKQDNLDQPWRRAVEPQEKRKSKPRMSRRCGRRIGSSLCRTRVPHHARAAARETPAVSSMPEAAASTSARERPLATPGPAAPAASP